MAVDIGELLGRLLSEGARHSDDTHDYHLTMVPVGDVTLPTGRVVACDPLVYAGDSPPFTVPVTPGRYPLRAWVAVISFGPPGNPVESDRRTAALQLVIRDQPTTTWEPARLPDPPVPDPASVDEDGFPVYPVDSGTGTFADEQAVTALAGWPYERLEDAYIPAVIEAAPSPLDAVTHEASGANVLLVSTGWGDGAYATFIGRGADGEVTSFVTDFRVL
ncbi:DUF4241 domain-containing protein [Winogradskya humida]|uniref:DUF4241 domain-containing protein n=1 Tax=Winogradskya humida TaxID=113566 RepID=A0ABQ3ZQZ2_9ACTN|nr:DUF4241 domain-containing protein [Actinoplanes humidus]GIE20602.1 hypothetical protein Ahu01nite_037040 [Actinoplanes humidus]